MKSLNQIIAELEAFANVHYQIHTFGHGDPWEIAPNSSEITYPVLWYVPQGATTGLNEVVTNFTILCMDLVRSGEENETEVLSDTLQILLDVISYYRQQHDQDYIIEFGSNIQPFTERDPDMLSGHSITVSIRQPFNYSECAIPFSGAPTPIVPECSPATVQNAASNPTYQASVASGGSLVLPQIKVLDSDGVTEITADYLPSADGYVAECSTPTCADATVENSDESYSTTVASGGTLVVPDTDIKANGDLVVGQPSGVEKDIVVRYETQGTVSTTIVSGEVVVPDSILPLSPFVLDAQSVGGNWLIDSRGDAIQNSGNLHSAWDLEAAGQVTISFFWGAYLTKLGGRGKVVGFTELSDKTALHNWLTNATTNGVQLQSLTALNAKENNAFVATVDNPSLHYESTYSLVVTPTSAGGDGLVRIYRDTTLLFTSSQVMVTAVPMISEAFDRGYALTKVQVIYG